jgi:hypothetical protein
MKMAEALILRADAQKRTAQLRERLMRSARIQEGDTPPEDPQELLTELRRVIADFADLVKRINRTNSNTEFGEGVTLTDALADRDALALERGALENLVNAAAGNNQFRYMRSEIKQIATINVAETQRRMDDLARQYRELDSAIQALNWQVELM